VSDGGDTIVLSVSADPYRLFSLAVFSFGFAAFLSLFVLWLRQKMAFPQDFKDVSYPVVFLANALWFGVNIVSRDFWIVLACACVFPPLLSHLFHPSLSRAVVAGSCLLAAAALGRAPQAWLLAAYSLLFAATAAAAFRLPAIGRPNRILLAFAALLIPAWLYLKFDWLSLSIRSLPLLLLLVHSFSFRRFLFLDLFLKWGAYFLLALASASLFFLWLPDHAPPLVKALALLPLIWALPRVCRWLGALLDKHWFGRTYTPVEAQRVFLNAIQSQPSEFAALQKARTVLEEVFRASVTLDASAAPRCSIELARRQDGRPFFSEDVELRDALAETLGVVVANRRAELRALRAQINPHFLFNALNAVAALIPENPERAESTLEQLSDVFRYQLKHSGSEMVTVEQELEFVRAYLAVEKARFEEGFEWRTEVDPLASGFRIPAMTVHTLVENSIKHGVSHLAGRGDVSVRAFREGGSVIVEVSDSGPGLAAGRGDGHGLENVRARLRGHFGEGASLTLVRENGMTVARIEVRE
jgi:signal transduction histidine kinase